MIYYLQSSSGQTAFNLTRGHVSVTRETDDIFKTAQYVFDLLTIKPKSPSIYVLHVFFLSFDCENNTFLKNVTVLHTEIWCDDRKGFIVMMGQAPVSVAAAVFVVLSSVGQADKGALRSVQSGVMGVGATLLTAGPRAGTQCGCGTGAPTGHGKRLRPHTAAERQN